MELFLKGYGVIQNGAEKLYEGRYIIERSGSMPIGIRTPGVQDPLLMSDPNDPTVLSGIFEAKFVTVARLMEDYRSGSLAKELTLVLEDGRNVEVHLTLAQEEFDAEKELAFFRMAFSPLSTELLLKGPAPEKKKYFAEVRIK